MSAEEKKYALSVSSGDPKACRKFMDEHSDLVLSRVYALMKGHCHYPAWDRACCLVVLQRQRKGSSLIPPVNQCDECMDSYLWFFDFLKRKVKAYQGINDCSLKTFIWSVVHSRTTYLEWLRWRYGRAY